MIRLDPPQPDLVAELLPFLALPEKQREQINRSLRERWVSGFWWGAWGFFLLGGLGGWLLHLALKGGCP